MFVNKETTYLLTYSPLHVQDQYFHWCWPSVCPSVLY